MKNRFRSIMAVSMAAVLMVVSTGCSQQSSQTHNDELSSWTQGSAVKQSLVDYVKDVTDKNSKDYIPEEDRIVACDVDGTLMCEKPFSSTDQIAIYRIETDLASDSDAVAAKDDYIKNLNIKDGGSSERWNKFAGAAFKGMTQDDIVSYTIKYLDSNVDGFDNLTHRESFYKPMIELLSYLKNNGFTIYLDSGSELGVLWGIADSVLNIPRSQCVGTTFKMQGQRMTDPNDYSYVLSQDEDIVASDEELADNDGLSKTYDLYYVTGKKPVMAFGNSSGDYSMLNMTKGNQQYKTYTMIVNHDDENREYSYNADQIKTEAEQNGWQCVSMKDDFAKMFLNDSASKK